MSDSAPIRARGLNAGYGGRQVLHGLDFELARRRLSVVLGPGGAGKTTLVRALVGERPKVRGLWWTGELSLPGIDWCALFQQSPSFKTVQVTPDDGPPNSYRCRTLNEKAVKS